MKFYEKLYVGESIDNVKKVKHRLSTGAGQFNVYLITLCAGRDQLDIFHCAYIKDRHFDRRHLFVAGIAGSQGEAFGLVEQMAKDSWAYGTEGNLKEYLQRTDGERKGKLWR